VKCFENDPRPIRVAPLGSRGTDKLIKLGLLGESECNGSAWTAHALEYSYFAYFVK